MDKATCINNLYHCKNDEIYMKLLRFPYDKRVMFFYYLARSLTVFLDKKLYIFTCVCSFSQGGDQYPRSMCF